MDTVEKKRGSPDGPKGREPTKPAYGSAAEEVLSNLLRARNYVWLDPETEKYVYRALGCAFMFRK